MKGKMKKDGATESEDELIMGGGGAADQDDKRKRAATGGSSIRKGSGGGGASSTKSCQAEKCSADLSEAKTYHRRHKVCEHHARLRWWVVAGIRQRFCQQCSRFQHAFSVFSTVYGLTWI
ncbi:UNVERIFIED_CONTAM: Squamosa promoter-binding-like protein 8 [Sesamum radiatum]|uniref:Squamosa promoter-binding-like protein 8 n=1 Tax=Sesamum radiatum TaxID=300843 RepID=A0AAW2J050_SESRA